MIKYHETLKIVNPMRATAKEKGEELAKVQAVLAEKQAKVKAIMDQLATLNAEQEALVAKAQQLNDDIEDCGKKLIRAEKMISGLEGEKVRWTETVARLTVEQGFLTGDCLIAAGMVSYAGPFISQYREGLEKLWRDKCEDL
jgi:dynein heavy chain